MGFLVAPSEAIRRYRAQRAAQEPRRQRLAQLVGCGAGGGRPVSQPAASHCLSSASVGGPVLPAGYAAMDIAKLDEQAQKLRSTVARRRMHPGAGGEAARTDNIIAHYERLIEGLEQQIGQLQRLQRAGA
mmetsp:Transcript_11862/g.33820  ORF Transcript_11862/g.33820 Transcript_11862/m.33820 type:complete len:130 (-) Transcript_11862:113-502(-)